MARQTEKPDGLTQLKNALRENKPAGLYVFHGEEVYLLHHYLDQMRSKLLDELTADFNYHRFTQETFDLQMFLDAVENMPMMAERSLVQVDEVDIFKLPEGDRDQLARTLADIPDYCTVIFAYEITPWNPVKKAGELYSVICNHAQIVEFAKQSQRDLVAWIGRHFAAHKKTISTDLCLYLIEITGGTMTAIGSEIAKIAAYSGADQIKKSDIDAVTEPVLDSVVYHMTDHIASGEYEKAFMKLQQLFKLHQEPLSILGAVGGHLRRLATARVLLDHGKSAGELLQYYKMGDYAAKKLMSSARRFSPRFFETASSLVLETDYQIKTSQDDPQRLLETLILQLSQEARK